MTEQEWLTSTDPAAMLRAITVPVCEPCPHGSLTGGNQADNPMQPSDRKLRLFVHACVLHTAPKGHPRNSHDSWIEKGLADPSLKDTGAEQADIWTKDVPAMFLKPRADLLRQIVGNPWRPVTLDPAHRTPLVLSLAEAAYEERAREEECPRCFGARGRSVHPHRGVTWFEACPQCKGAGKVTIDDGTLDPFRLGLLADALEDAGCPEMMACVRCDGRGGRMLQATDRVRSAPGDCRPCANTGRVPNPLLAALREPVARYRGFWALDLVLNKE